MSQCGQMTAALQALTEGRDLTLGEAEATILSVLAGNESDVSVAALLTAWRVKGETADELTGVVRAVRSRVDMGDLRIESHGLLDTCGTGGDGARTLNISTAAAIVVAACGIPVAKHGNRAASGNSGSAEVLQELGVAIDADSTAVSRCLGELGITFLFAPRFHPGLRMLAPVRRQLPFRTLFNLVGPLVNPAAPDYQLIGVPGKGPTNLMAQTLAKLGVRRAALVSALDGMDEVSLSGPTQVLLVQDGTLEEREWRPEDFGLGPVSSTELRISGPVESASKIRDFLAGKPGPERDIILANAAAALWVAGESDLKAAVRNASQVVDSGQALNLLKDWARLSQESRR
ncbi:MAG: anthranilate phosphoribosyltransferase [Isosphaeraceae bacterium]